MAELLIERLRNEADALEHVQSSVAYTETRVILREAAAELARLTGEVATAKHDELEHVKGHWFIQGGKAQFGEVREAQNADELISTILDLVREKLTDAEAELARVTQERDDYRECYEDTKRLAREIGAALDGDQAARQPSLCDLVGPVRDLKASATAAELDAHEAKKEIDCGGPGALCYSADYGFGLCKRHMATALAEATQELAALHLDGTG